MEIVGTGLESEDVATSIHRSKVLAGSGIRTRSCANDVGLGWRAGTVDAHDRDRPTRHTAVRNGNWIGNSKRIISGKYMHGAAWSDEPDHFVDVRECCGVFPISSGTV